MRARCLFPLLLAVTGAGCFDDHGAVLEIDVGNLPGTDTVELFISSDQCTSDPNCRAISSLDLPRVAGDVWYRDSASRITAPVKGHKATFKLETDHDTMLSLLIAVGTAENKTTGLQIITGLVVPASGSKLVATSLGTTPELTVSNLSRGAKIWTTPNDVVTPTSCLAVAQSDNAGNVMHTFIVPKDDVDCDGKPNDADCFPSSYVDPPEVGPETDEPMKTCANKQPTACVLGSFGCSAADQTTCFPQIDQTCLPTGLCTLCQSRSLTDCVDLWAPEISTLPRVECVVPTDDDNECEHDAMAIELGVPMLVGGCDTAELTAIVPELIQFDKQADFAGAGLSIAVDDKKRCTLKLTWRGGSVEGTALKYGLIKLETKKGRTLLPFVVRFEDNPTCNNGTGGFRCAVPPSDLDLTMWSCLGPQ